MKRLLLLAIFLIANLGLAEVPQEIRQTAGYKTAEMILIKCTSSADALLCLSEAGSVCEPIVDDGREAYRCVLSVSVEATREGDSSNDAEHIGEFSITSRLTNTVNGWSAEIESVEKAG